MKNTQGFAAEKYGSSGYEPVDAGIYERGGVFVTSLCFQQEPALGEGADVGHISQYPLEDLLDRFSVYVSDCYTELNDSASVCHLEFASPDLANIQALRQIIGKHVYDRKVHINDADHIELVIE